MEGTRSRENDRKTWMSAIEKRTGIKLPRATELDKYIEKWRLFLGEA